MKPEALAIAMIFCGLTSIVLILEDGYMHRHDPEEARIIAQQKTELYRAEVQRHEQFLSEQKRTALALGTNGIDCSKPEAYCDNWMKN